MAVLGLIRKLVFTAITFAIILVRAELPPWVYDELKATTEEVLPGSSERVDTVELRNISSLCEIHFTVSATVIDVDRTAAGFEEGDVVVFWTWVREDDWDECRYPGPPRPPSFQPGWCGLAYLNSTEIYGILRPTCHGFSFEQYFDSE
jgi:hypothetical protein